MTLFTRFVLVWVGLLLSFTCFSENTLKIGLLAYRPKAQVEAHWQALIPYLNEYFKERHHAERFQLKVYDYSELESAIQRREIDFIVTNPANYVVLEHRLGLTQPLAGLVSEYQGIPMRGFGGAMLIKADRSDLKTLDDIKGKRIGAIGINSFGGYQMQAFELAEHGLNITKEAKSIEMFGVPHDKIIQALIEGRIDVGFVRSGLLEEMLNEKKVAPGILKVLNLQDLPGFPLAASTRLYPEWPIAALPHVNPEQAGKFTAALLSLPQGGTITKAMGIYAFAIPYNYEPVRELVRILRIPPYDTQPKITWEDIWLNHWPIIITLALFVLLILVLIVTLFKYNRELISTRQQLEEDAKHLEYEKAHLRTLINTMPDLVWLKDPNGVYLTCNRLFEQLYDAKESEIIGRTDYDFNESELAKFFREHDLAAIAANSPLMNQEWLTFKTNGYCGFFETIKTPMHDSSGKLIGVLGIARDITERQQREEALAESEERFRKLFEDTMDASILLQDGHFSDANRACLEMFGITSTEMFCQLSPDALSPERQPDGMLSSIKADAMTNIALEQGAHFFEWEHKRANGECFPTEVLMTRILHKNQKIIHAVVRDISDRVTAENAVRKDTELRKQILESIPGIFYLFDQNGRFIVWNSNMEKLSQRSKTEVAAMHPLDLFDIPDKAKVEKEINRVMTEGSGSVEADMLVKHGNKIPYFWTGARIEIDGQPMLIGIGTDISERKQAEIALQNSENNLNRAQAIGRIGSWTIDLANNQLLWSTETYRIFGIPLGENVDLARFISTVHPDDREKLFLAWNAALDGSDYDIEHRIVVNGQTLWVRELAEITHSKDGKPLSAVGTVQDITERKLILEQLDEERRRLRDIIDGTHAGTWEWNLQTGACYFNERWAEIFGYTLAELSPFNTDTWKAFIHPDDYKLANRLLQEHFDEKSDYYECEVRMKHKQGHWVWVSDRGRLINRTPEGKPLLISGTHVDITKRKHAEQELKASEQRFRNMAENTTDWLWACDLQGQHIYSNQVCVDFFGYGFEQLRTIDTTNLIHPDDLQLFISTLDNAAKHKTGWKNIVIRWKGRQGTYLSLESSGVAILDESGNVIGFQGIDRDITERLQAQQALKESEFFLRESQRIGNLGGWRANPMANTLMWTEGVYNIVDMPLDYTPDLKTGLDFYPPDSRERVVASLNNTLTTGQPFSIEVEVRDSKGVLKGVELRGFPHYQGEQIDYLMGTLQDITERKRSIENLQKLWLAVEQSPNIIIITNLDAKIEYVNRRYQEATGYSNQEAIGRIPEIMQSQNNGQANGLSVWNALKDGKQWSGECVNRRKDGSEYILQAYISPVCQLNGEISHYLLIEEDITEKKRMAEELNAYHHHLENLVKSRTIELEQAREAAEMASRSKSVFLANMSHEIRTPMNAIMGMTHLLRRDLHDPKHLDKLSKINVASKHLLGLINDILDLSKIEAERLTIEETAINLGSIIDHVCSMMMDRALNKGIAFIQEIDPLLRDLTLSGDPLRIGQILINYVGNAVKFTERGQIALRAKLLSQNDQNVDVRFEVQDTGIGMTEEQQARVFDAFEQGHTSTTRKYGGTGLGLTISRHLAHMMKGEVGVKCSEGIGCIFWFNVTLNRIDPSSLPVAIKVGAIDFRHNATILLVEDNEINQEVAKQLLESTGLIVDVAWHGGEALELVKHKHYDLILMDMQMPVMDGLEATRQIRLLPAYGSIPIIAMTANAFEEDKQQCMIAGMNDFLSKPFDPDMLFSVLIRWIPKPSKMQANSTEPQIELSILTNSPQLNVDNGLRSFSGKQEKYLEFLKRFLTIHANDASLIETMLANGDREAARRQAHSLKGVAALLGLEQVRESALTLEQELKLPESVSDIGMLIAGLSEAIKTGEITIRKIMTGHQADAPKLINQLELKQRIVMLESSLLTNNLEAINVWREIEPQLSEIINNERLENLRQQLEQYDLPAALENLRSIIEEYPQLHSY
ncbi:PAS domain S-box protein [Methylocucumis oryzae]|uniref:PAS domain S-box protein n=1 Tax=Methylocucumis oryzae TaxID=1632867 RepID=UPI00069647DD|nr:PAS domain S-box protein [Methylocucumis oryzae]